MKVGDLVVHVGAKPNGYRIKMVCAIETIDPKASSNNFIACTDIIVFADGRSDFKRLWRVFNGWENYENR